MPKPKPPRRPRLDPDRIVAAAMGIIERQGPEALSTRRLAERLDCEAMSLYHYFPNLEAILDAVVDRAFAGLPDRVPAGMDVRAQLEMLAGAYLELAREKPQLFRLIGRRRWRTPAALG